MARGLLALQDQFAELANLDRVALVANYALARLAIPVDIAARHRRDNVVNVTAGTIPAAAVTCAASEQVAKAKADIGIDAILAADIRVDIGICAAADICIDIGIHAVSAAD